MMKVKGYSLLFYLLFSVLLWNCETAKNKKEEKSIVVSDSAEESGKVVLSGVIQTKINCDSVPEASYALYLPKGFDKSKKYPVMFIFDPQGNGELAISKYRAVADKYQYIMVGSYNSRNGIKWELIKSTSLSIMKEVLNKYPIDRQRIYTMGFSGGARVAAELAKENAGICGVIAQGAGFQNSQAKLSYDFEFYGIIGKGDFNLPEMQDLSEMLKSTNMVHFIKFYEGIHEWAPAEEVDWAMTWLEFQAMKRYKIPRNDTAIEYFIKDMEGKILHAKEQKNTYETYEYLRKLSSFTKGLKELGEIDKEIVSISNGVEFQKLEKERLAIKERELTITKAYWKSLGNSSYHWWEKEIKKLRANHPQSSSNIKQMNQRILGFLGLAVYIQSNQAVLRLDETNARKLLKIYQYLEPQNSEALYLTAALEAGLGNKEQCLTILETAHKKGFTPSEQTLNNPHFESIKNDPNFKKLMSGNR